MDVAFTVNGEVGGGRCVVRWSKKDLGIRLLRSESWVATEAHSHELM